MADRKNVKDEAKEFPQHPEGPVAAVCVDVVDLGLRPESFQGQPAVAKDKTALVFRTAETREDGKPWELSIELTTSLGKKSNMRRLLEAWRGKPYTDEETKKQGIPLDKLAGVPALLTVSHQVSAKGNTYAKIMAVGPLPKAMAALTPSTSGYERQEFWAKKQAQYRAEFEAHAAKQPSGKADADFDDFPEALDEDDGSIPF